MKKFAIYITVLAGVFALTGCVTTDSSDKTQYIEAAVASHKGVTEQRLIQVYDRKPKTYDYNDGSRELTWRWSESNPYAPLWCQLNVTVGPDGKVTGASYKRSDNYGGLRICDARIIKFN